MKKLLTRLSSVLLLVTIVISAVSMSGHVFAQTDRQNQGTKVILQSSEESLEPAAGKTADNEQTGSSEEITQNETAENIESEENITDSEVQQNSEENSNEQPESSLFSDRMRPSDTLTAGSLEIEDTRSLSKYDTINTLKDFTYTVSFSNLTPDKIYKYQTTSNIKYFTAESNGTATLQIVLRANQTVTFSDVANASYKITTSKNATSAASYTAIAGDGVLKKTSDQAEKGSTLSSEMETVSATSGTAFTFKHQFYYNFIIDSIVKSASEISPSAHLVFPVSMKGQLIQIEGTGSSVAVGDDAAADMPIVNGQKMILSNISSSDIDQMYDSSELISIPDVPGYTSSLTKHIEDNGDITANINYKEYGYQIIYHGNGADDELTETVVDDDIQNTYSFSTKDTSSFHYLYVDLTRNGNTINYKITLSPIGIMYLKNREGTIIVNGVKKSVILNAPSGEISEIDSGSFEINDTGDTYFSCRVEAKKTHIMTSNWTADFGNNKLGTRTKYEVSKIIDNLTYSEVKNLHANPYTKTGYLFTGWNTRADGTGIGYTETQEISQLAAADKDEDSIDLYAQWTPIRYSIKYSGNDATGGSMSNSSYTYDQAGSLAQNQFEKNYTLTFNHNYSGSTDSTLISNCKFSGWNGSDGKKYADKAEVKNLTSKNNDVITMTARWTPASVTLPSPSRDGYTFDGWYSAASGGNKVGSAGDSITPESNETYYAHWSPIRYTVVFNANNGEGSMTPLSLSYDTSEKLTKNTLIRSKYRFLHWTTNADGSGTEYLDGAPVKNLASVDGAKVELYAQWEKLTDLKVGVSVSGNMGSRVKEFEFQTAFPACFQNRTFNVVKPDGSRESVNIGSDGAVRFTLKHGETFVIEDLDTEQIRALKDISDRCVREADYGAEGYVTRHSSSVEDDGTLRVDFSNAKNTGVPTGAHDVGGTKVMFAAGLAGLIVVLAMIARKRSKKN